MQNTDEKSLQQIKLSEDSKIARFGMKKKSSGIFLWWMW